MQLSLTTTDGHTLDCHLTEARGERVGGIVILQEIFGVTEQLKGVAKRYAKQGYDVAIPALFDRQQREAVIPFDQGPRGRDLMLASDPAETLRDIEAVVDALAARGCRVAVIGFCWGGGLALRAAQTLEIVAAISFYGTRLPEYLNAPLKAAAQGHFGTEDSHVPPEMLAQLEAYYPEMQVFRYAAGHAFANDARSEHVPEAAELAHQRTLEFLSAAFQPANAR